MLLVERRPSVRIGTFRVGDAVFLEGTGRWWAGSTFRAVIADVRASDDSIKVRYSDGGFKRFPRAEFVSLVRKADDVAGSEFAPSALDTFDDTVFAKYGSPEQRTRDLEETRLRQKIEEALRNGDAAKEEQTREALASLQRRWEALEIERAAVREAIQRKDFLRAHDIQTRIDALEVAASAQKKAPANIGKESLRRALGGGVLGAAAMAVQVTTLMWLRTTLYYQYRYGASTWQALRVLYGQGGVLRFYQGFIPALLQGPLSRFGDTAANVGIMSFFDSQESLRDVPLFMKTFVSASVAATWRIFLMPIDTVKTMLQVEGRDGVQKLRAKYRAHGVTIFYHGSLGLSGASFIGHYFWYGTYNAADARVPVPTDLLPRTVRNAAIGFAASAVADTSTNAIRVLKTYRQTSETGVTYTEAAQAILAKEGVLGLWGRGLGTRILANGIQASLFTATWKYLQQKYL